ncbi:DNA polymerase III subunit delta' [Gloeobacter violaceus]|uniref:DNA polymerase III delta prime subunit n=1 Tax=Gloeobacter violaceus (strain ATCC 29082 / PCC 7421) TaxID=251221 RepID=Q7NKP5_GLOVI|nr:DNA polymerase III subunit delta' [Gloeobacter violaceus]BAC89373.1 DNA polymerase III delta prime subunit [Gloeobacter violaceus PCC 7421]
MNCTAQSSVKGQPLAMALLERAIVTGRIAPAYLFCGPQGVGKAMAARHFAARLLESALGRIERGNHPDLLWVEPTYKKGDKLLSRAEALAEGGNLPRALPQVRLEQVRGINQFLSRPPLEAARQVIVIEGAEAMGDGAANALLKILEEPGGAVFVLIAPSAGGLLATVRSRCQKVPFCCLPHELVAQILAALGKSVDERLLAMAQGSPGRALELQTWLFGIPPELLAEAEKWAYRPLDLRSALTLARRIDAELNLEQQIPLVDYLQQLAWAAGRVERLAPLEALRTQLLGYVSPRLAWEVGIPPLPPL